MPEGRVRHSLEGSQGNNAGVLQGESRVGQVPPCNLSSQLTLKDIPATRGVEGQVWKGRERRRRMESWDSGSTGVCCACACLANKS